jgi:ABC-type transport system involved in multi-copper enzyme maturation permease subunit
MIVAMKAEIRKLLTVRSTYIMLLVALLLGGFINYWVVGYKAGQDITDVHYLQNAVLVTVYNLSMFAGIVGILLMTHEYRYNTIYYALTSMRSRTKLLLAKTLAVCGYAVVYSVLLGAFSVLMVMLGLNIGNHELVAQSFQWGELLWRGLVYIFGITLIGLILAILIRNQIGTIVVYLFMPGTIEMLASLVLKDKAAYLPFTALTNIVADKPVHLSYAASAFVVLSWVVGGWIIGWILFLRRDAN